LIDPALSEKQTHLVKETVKNTMFLFKLYRHMGGGDGTGGRSSIISPVVNFTSC
jgi:hypothetical protein